MKILVLLALTLSPLSFAADDGHDHEHTGQFCSARDADLCLHLGLPKKFSTKEEGKFMVHFTVAPEVAANIVLNKAELWMDSMGHGSAPTKMQKVGEGKFFVTNAWFFMTGPWEIKIDYTMNGVADQIVVPVEITE